MDSGKLFRGAVFSLSAIFLAGCGDDPAGPGNSGDDLTAAEAAVISNFMAQAAFDAWNPGNLGGGGGGGASLTSGVPIEIDFDVDASNGCPLGGTVAISGSITGTIDDQTGSGDLQIQLATSAASCAFSGEGSEFTVSTSPDLVLDGQFSFANGQLDGTASFSYVGGLSWSSDDGRSGTCNYDVLVTLDAAGGVVQSGTVCGSSV